ncbi:MAG: ATP synthase F1 subunit epsilon [Myxococcota bacterium]
MSTALEVDIVTPERSVFRGAAAQVQLPAWEGEMGVLPDHDPLLALLRAGLCVVSTAQGATRYVIGRGFAEIGGDRVTILTDHCEPAEKVDKASAQTELAAAEAEMAQHDAWSERYRQARIAYELARARLDA